MFTDLQWGKLKISYTVTTNVPYKDVVEDQQYSELLQGDLKISHVHIYFPQIYTDMRRLTTGIRCDKCVVRRFRLCANVIECTYTNLDSIWNENQLMSLFYSYIAGSLHVSGPQAHLQESSYSCSHNHWFSICPLWTRVLYVQHREHASRADRYCKNQWLCEQLYELS